MRTVAGMIAGLAAMLLAGPTHAFDSTYTKIDFDNGCTWAKPADDIEEQMGGSAVCRGLGGYDIHFSEFDLRQAVDFGPVDEAFFYPSGFAQFNRINDTVEWRLDNGKPFATILRWFIENPDPDTGDITERSTGQVLVISTVADPGAPPSRRRSCIAGYVDARENANANELARQVADTVARDFDCDDSLPEYHGKRGPLSGSPLSLAD